jgi:hypothetical protein
MVAPMCYSCVHWVDDPEDYPKCAAFPDGIPPTILFWEASHLVPIPNDNGIQFEQDPGKRPLDMEIVNAVFSKGPRVSHVE